MATSSAGFDRIAATFRPCQRALHNWMNKLILQDLAICSGLMLMNWELFKVARNGGAYEKRRHILLIIFVGFIYAIYLLFYSKTIELIPFKDQITSAYFSVFTGGIIFALLNSISRVETADLDHLFLSLIQHQLAIFGMLFLTLTVLVLLEFFGI